MPEGTVFASDAVSGGRASIGNGGSNPLNMQSPCWCGHSCKTLNCCDCGCICSSKKVEKLNDKAGEYTYQNGRYEDAPYHHANSKGNDNYGKSPAPKDG